MTQLFHGDNASRAYSVKQRHCRLGRPRLRFGTGTAGFPSHGYMTQAEYPRIVCYGLPATSAVVR